MANKLLYSSESPPGGQPGRYPSGACRGVTGVELESRHVRVHCRDGPGLECHPEP